MIKSGPGGTQKSAQMATSHDPHKLRHGHFSYSGVPGNLINYIRGREIHGGGGIEMMMVRSASAVQRKSNQRKSDRAKRSNIVVKENVYEAFTLKCIALTKRVFANSIEKKFVRCQVANPLDINLAIYKKQVDDLRYTSGSYERRAGELLDNNSALYWESDTSISDGLSGLSEDEKG